MHLHIDPHSKDEPSVVFLATPSPVVFSTYQVGHVYESLLNLKNVSAASRPLRVRPPKSQHFAVGLGKHIHFLVYFSC